MIGGRGSKYGFTAAAVLVLVFLYLPLFLIVLYAFNKTTVNSWPFPGFSTRWFVKLWHDPAPLLHPSRRAGFRAALDASASTPA